VHKTPSGPLRADKFTIEGAVENQMLNGMKKFIRIVLAVLIGISLISCAALNRTEYDNPDHEKSESGKKIPLPPTMKDFDGDSE
jgi:hypothetical protein